MLISFMLFLLLTSIQVKAACSPKAIVRLFFPIIARDVHYLEHAMVHVHKRC